MSRFKGGAGTGYSTPEDGRCSSESRSIKSHAKIETKDPSTPVSRVVKARGNPPALRMFS